MATRTVHRGNKGRFAGSSGGKAEQVRVSRRSISGSRATVSRSRPVAKGTAKKSSPRGIRLSHNTKTRLKRGAITVGVTAGTGLAVNAAVNKALPSQTFNKSTRTINGNQSVVDASRLAKGTKITSVSDGKLTYVTQSQREGRGLKAKVTTTTLVGRQGSKGPIGMVHSERSVLGRTNNIKTSYLTVSHRGKGIGSRALTAHAAHDPGRRHRASITRSVQGQAFAARQGGAGIRSSSSKKKGASLTREMDSQWKANRFQYGSAYSSLKAATSGKQGVTTMNVNAMKRGKKIRK